MKTEKEIKDRIEEEIQRLKTDKGYMASATRGWLDALEWVLE